MMSNKPLGIGPRLKKPIPYIQGFGLTHPQLDAVVSYVLSHQTIKSYGGDILVAIRAELQKAGQDFTIVPFATGPKSNRQIRYLYIVDVIPSWNGERPKFPILKKTAEDFFNTFGRDEWLEELRTFCIRWPEYEPEPEWLQPRLWKAVKILGDWVKRHMTPEEIEAAMQETSVETEEELRALKHARADMGAISSIDPSNSDHPPSLETNSTLAPRGENSNLVAQAIPPPPAPISSQFTPMDTNTVVTATSIKKKRKASPPEPTHAITRPKRACTMKK